MASAISAQRLTEFRAWLQEDGRQEGTAELYANNLRMCAASPGGLTHRLTAGELSPNTLRTNLAALRAWASFTDDAQLLIRLKRIRLPAVRRVKPKFPFDLEVWKRLVREIRGDRRLNALDRACLEIIAVRGLRCADVARLKQTDLVPALRTGVLSYEGKGRRRHEADATALRRPIEVILEAGREYTARHGRKWARIEDILVRHGAKSAGHLRRRVATRRLARAVAAIAKRSNIEGAHPHRFRRTYATEYLLRMPNDPQALSKLQAHMGWANPDTALQYVDAVSKDELDARGNALVDELE